MHTSARYNGGRRPPLQSGYQSTQGSICSLSFGTACAVGRPCRGQRPRTSETYFGRQARPKAITRGRGRDAGQVGRPKFVRGTSAGYRGRFAPSQTYSAIGWGTVVRKRVITGPHTASVGSRCANRAELDGSQSTYLAAVLLVGRIDDGCGLPDVVGGLSVAR